MEVSRIRALRGPNLWSRHTAIEAIVSCNENERNISDLPGFEDRLRERFPAIALLQASVGNDVVSMAHAVEYAALGLQAQAGCPVTFSRTTQTEEPGVYQVVVEYSEEAVGRLAFELALELCRAAVDDHGDYAGGGAHAVTSEGACIRQTPAGQRLCRMWAMYSSRKNFSVFRTGLGASGPARTGWCA